MNDDDIRKRLRRIKAAMGDVSQLSPHVSAPVVIDTPQVRGVFQDWSGGRSEEHMEKDANSIIQEFMGLPDRMKTWLKERGRKEADVYTFLKSHKSAALIHDLGNTDKHWDLKNPPQSGIKPKLVRVRRVMRITAEAGAPAYVRIGLGGQQEVVGNSALILTADVLDEQGTVVAELDKLFEEALTDWDGYMRSEGVTL